MKSSKNTLRIRSFLFCLLLTISNLFVCKGIEVNAATITKLSSTVEGTVSQSISPNHLNVRSGPTTKDEVIASLNAGTVITITGYSGDSKTGWYEIKKSGISIGYVSREFIVVKVKSITISPIAVNITEGNTAILTATVTPVCASNTKVTWSSSNTTVATVDGAGKVTGKKNGTAVITAKTSDGGMTAKCTVVVGNGIVAATDLKLNKTATTINVDSSEILAATISPSNVTDKRIIWTSSNASVAVVDENGKVTGKKNGTAVITVQTYDGSKVAKCTVTVSSIFPKTGWTTENLHLRSSPSTSSSIKTTIKKNTQISVTGIDSKTGWFKVKLSNGTTGYCSTAYITFTNPTNPTKPVTSVKLSASSAQINVKSSKILTATVSPSNAVSKAVIWTSSNTSIATVDAKGKVTGKKVGKVTIKVKTKSGNKTASCTVLVTPKTSSSGYPKDGWATVNLNIRAGASTSSKRIVTISKNTKVTITGKVSGSAWYTVKLANGTLGYCSTNYITFKKSSSSSSLVIGKLSAKYESNGKSGAIGYSSAGKSYGAYQFASHHGIVKEFLKWLKKANNNYYIKLNDAYKKDGSRYGSNFDAAWVKIAKDDSQGFLLLQHDYTKYAYYDVAAAGIKKKYGVDVNSRSLALQNVLWSTAVQHGTNGAIQIFGDIKVKNIDKDKDIINQVYDERCKRFSGNASVLKRLKSERKDALAML